MQKIRADFSAREPAHGHRLLSPDFTLFTFFDGWGNARGGGLVRPQAWPACWITQFAAQLPGVRGVGRRKTRQAGRRFSTAWQVYHAALERGPDGDFLIGDRSAIAPKGE